VGLYNFLLLGNIYIYRKKLGKKAKKYSFYLYYHCPGRQEYKCVIKQQTVMKYERKCIKKSIFLTAGLFSKVKDFGFDVMK
jgi:hypothetical protein